MMREVIFYDGVNDRYCVRHDVLCAHGKPNGDGSYNLMQFGCDHQKTCGPTGHPDIEWLAQVRIKARHALGRHIGRLGVESLVRLPDPWLSAPIETLWVDDPVLPFVFNGKATRRKTHAGAK